MSLQPQLSIAAQGNGRTVRLDGTLMDLAAEIGLSHEVLYRTLTALEKDGSIIRNGVEIILRRQSSI